MSFKLFCLFNIKTLQRPVNAVKELLENSLDAGSDRISTQIQVPQHKSSESSLGLFSISVTDNGCGISKEDLGLLCERHATSKLRSAADLSGIGTYGFRGEALASCSQVARVEVITRRRDSEVAWRVSYLNGKMSGEPIPCAGNPGTTIHVKDLFYGHRVRREALQASNEEYSRIVQVVQAYALNYAGRCAFQLSKRRDRMDMQSGLDDDVVRVIKTGWGEEIGAAVMSFEIGIDEGLGIESGSGGWATRTTFHRLKSPQVILFLNGRLIEHPSLRRALLQAFAQHLPTSPPAYPFIYLDLRIKGNRVDVNVHPSKRQVVFLDEIEIVEKVISAVDGAVLRKQYQSQTFNPIIIEKDGEKKRFNEDVKDLKKVENENMSFCYSKRLKENTISNERIGNIFNEKINEKTNVKTNERVGKISTLYPSQRVLTDHRNQRIDTFLFHSNAAGAKEWSPLQKSSIKSEKENELEEGEGSADGDKSFLVVKKGPEGEADNSILLDESSFIEVESSKKVTEPDNSESQVEPKRVESSGSLSKTMPQANEQMSMLLKRSVVVGLIDSRWCLLQSGTNLLLGDMDVLNRDLFYSLLVNLIDCDEGCDGISVDLGVKEVFEDESDGMEAEMMFSGLKDAFSTLHISVSSDGKVLKSIPLILTGQRQPNPANLKTFMQRLCLVPEYSKPGWEETVISELAALYALIDGDVEDWEGYVKHVILPAYRDQRARFYNPTGIKIITNTETLYKSFERC